jgi:hypothetical protein
MESLKKTLFIIAMVSVTGYTIRHMYLKWIDPRSSVLDKYEKPITSEIKNASSLKQLEQLYADAHRKVQAADSVDSVKHMEPYKRSDLEIYRNENELRNAIEEWEAKSREIFKIRFYWGVGLVLVVIGFILYKRVDPWLGITTLITGFGEMVYWTSPTFFYGAGFEYDHLLDNKIVLSIATLVLLVAGGFQTNTLKSNSKMV